MRDTRTETRANRIAKPRPPTAQRVKRTLVEGIRGVPSLTYYRLLTEYQAVSAEPPASHTTGSPAAAAVDESRPTGIDVRSLEWIRPLLGEYRLNFPRVSRSGSLGNPATDLA